jgi:catalase
MNDGNDNGGDMFEGDGIIPKPIKNHIYCEMHNKREAGLREECDAAIRERAELERQLERAGRAKCAEPKPITQIAYDLNNYNEFAPAEAVGTPEYTYVQMPENLNRVCGGEREQEKYKTGYEYHKPEYPNKQKPEWREHAREEQTERPSKRQASEREAEHITERHEYRKIEHPRHKIEQKNERPHEYRKIEHMNGRNEIHKNSPYNYYSYTTVPNTAPREEAYPQPVPQETVPRGAEAQTPCPCARPEYAPIYTPPPTPVYAETQTPLPYAPPEYASSRCVQPERALHRYGEGVISTTSYAADSPSGDNARAANGRYADAPSAPYAPLASSHLASNLSDAAYKPDYAAMENNPDITAKYDMGFVDRSVPMENNPMGNMLTGAAAAPVDSDQSAISTDVRGCQLLQDVYAVEKLAHFNRERIPERVVHANGSGAFGVFEVTNDLSKYTCAKIFSRVGKKTEMAARFSSVAAEKGGAQSVRDPRGFALKFYTEEGNYDIVGNDTPVFFIRDTIKFPDFIHSQKRNPATNLHDPNYIWDFFSLTPESIHQVTFLYSSRGIPLNFRHMDGFGANTFMWYNEKGEHVWVKYHFKTNQGIRNLTQEAADELAGTDPDSSTRDLRDSIERGDYPSWNAYVQIMTPRQADEYMFDAFDVTKVWFHKDFPLIPLGKMTLNRNPKNFFAEVEQLAFCPANMVRGVGPSFDKMLQGRMFGYLDTQRHRLGANFQQIPVNMPKGAAANTNQRDGYMTVNGNFGGNPNYFPSSFINNTTNEKYAVPEIAVGGSIKRHKIPLTDADFIQAGELYRRVLDTKEKDYLIHNILLSLKLAKTFIQYRQCALFYKADADYGTRVLKGLGLDEQTVKRLSSMTQEQRIEQTKGMM